MISRAIRPVMRSQPLASAMRTAAFSSRMNSAARPLASALTSKTAHQSAVEQKRLPTVASQLQARNKMGSNAPLMAAMPQLIPFYFVNEVIFGYAALVTLIYLMTKYWLPQTVRARLARLFISKL